MEKGLYTFKHVSTLDNVETIIKFIDEEGKEKEKLSLTEIDSFTLNFDSRENLLFYMQKIGYDFYNSKFIIEYKNNNKTKKIDPVFSDQENLKELALNNQGSYKIKKDASYYKYLYYIIRDIANNYNLIWYLVKNKYMSTWLYENVTRYNISISTDVEAAHIYMTRIKKELTKYKVVRDIEVGIKEYEKLIKTNANEKETNQNEEKPKVKTLKKPRHFIEGQGQLFNPDNY